MSAVTCPVSFEVDSLRLELEDAIKRLPSHLVTSWPVDEACRKLCAHGDGEFVQRVRARLGARYVPYGSARRVAPTSACLF